MKRDLHELENRTHDVVIVGGGIHGACIARDAALRGLSVALVEQNDFCSATSHNSLKTIHGGIRYLQHLNFKRAIESIREQQVFLKTAPHLVQPMNFLMPTYGYGMRGPLAMMVAIGLYELLCTVRLFMDQRRFQWPKGRIISAAMCRKIIPGLNKHNLTGGAMWADAQVAYADKAVLQILQHSVDHGAIVANYIRAESLVKQPGVDDIVCGVQVRDKRSDKIFVVSAPMVVNATGPWVGAWIDDSAISKTALQIGLVKSMNLVTNRAAPPMALGFKSERASDSRIDTAKRLFFNVPWLGKSVIGTTHFTHKESGVDLSSHPDEISQFLEEFNLAYPPLKLRLEDVLYCYQGLTPGDDNSNADGAKLHESKVVDHQSVDGVSGLVSVVSIKWTTARLVAQKTVDKILQLRSESRPCKTRREKIPDYKNMPHDTADLCNADLQKFTRLHIKHTQASSLCDVVLRRTNDLVLGRLTPDQVNIIMHTLAEHFKWSESQLTSEVKQLLNSGISCHQRHKLSAGITGVEL